MSSLTSPALSSEDINVLTEESVRLIEHTQHLEEKVAKLTKDHEILEREKAAMEVKLKEALERAEKASSQERILLEKVAHHDPDAPKREMAMSMVSQLHAAGAILGETRNLLETEIKTASEGPQVVFDKILSTVVESLNEAPSSGTPIDKQASSFSRRGKRPADPHGDWDWVGR